MKVSGLGLIALTIALVSCEPGGGPPLEASDIVIFEPLTGRTAAVAYLTLRNNSDRTIVLEGASSPGFARVEIHETVIDAGMARMKKVATLPVRAGADVSFAPGGLHIMLLEPDTEHRTGSLVTLEINYDQGGLLIVQAPMQARTTQ